MIAKTLKLENIEEYIKMLKLKEISIPIMSLCFNKNLGMELLNKNSNID